MTQLSDYEFLRSEIEHKGIYRCKPGVTIPAKMQNQFYTWQFYLRRCIYDPKFANIAAELLVKKLGSLQVQVGACEDAGVVLGMAIAQKLQIPMISIKKTPKKYGLKNMLEGPLVGLPILLVDDLAGSQITLVNNYNLLSSFQVPIASEYVTLVDKTIGTHDSYLKEKKLISLFKCEDFKLSWTNYVHEYNREPNFGISY